MEQANVSNTGRGTSDGLRAFAEREASALFATEVAQRQDQWRTALESVKHTLTDLGARCDTMMSAAPDAPTEAVSELIEKIVAAAAAETEALTQQMEARARAEAAEAQALIKRLQDEVGAGQEQLSLAREQLKVEQAARARAESAAQDAQVGREAARSALEAQLRDWEAELQSSQAEASALQQRLAAAQAEGASTSAALDALQRAVQGAMSTLTIVQPAAATSGPPAPHAGGARSNAAPAAVTEATIPSAAESSTADANRAGTTEALPTQLAPSRHASALIKSVEAMYEQDVKSGLPPADIVKRLTVNLRYAGQIFAERLRSDPAGDTSALAEQIAKLLRARSATSFGRDLAIAAREAERHE